MRSKSVAETVTSPETAKQIPFAAWDTGDCRTTSAGDRVIGGDACDIKSILSHQPVQALWGGRPRPLSSGKNAAAQSPNRVIPALDDNLI